MDDKAVTIHSFSKITERKWKESDETVSSFGAATFGEVCIFVYFSQGVVCCSSQAPLQTEGKKIVGNENLKKHVQIDR